MSIRDNTDMHSFKYLFLPIFTKEFPIKKDYNIVYLDSNFEGTQLNQSIQILT